MKGKVIRDYERLPLVNKTIEQFIADFAARREEMIELVVRGEEVPYDLQARIDIKAAVHAVCYKSGIGELTYSIYRAVRRFIKYRYGLKDIDRDLYVQGFYLEVLLSYLRLPQSYTIDDLVEHLISNSMLLHTVIKAAFRDQELSHRAYAYFYNRISRSEHGEKMAAVTKYQGGRGGFRGVKFPGNKGGNGSKSYNGEG